MTSFSPFVHNIIFFSFFLFIMSEVVQAALWEALLDSSIGVPEVSQLIGQLCVPAPGFVTVVLQDPDVFDKIIIELAGQDDWPSTTEGDCKEIIWISSVALTKLFQALSYICSENPDTTLSLDVLDPFCLAFFGLACEEGDYYAIDNDNDPLFLEALCKLLEANIKKFSLDGSMLNERNIGTRPFLQALGRSSIHTLSLNRVLKGHDEVLVGGDDDNVFLHMRNALLTNTTITHLDISGNFMTAAFIRAFVEIFNPNNESRNTTMQGITFFEDDEENDELDEESALMLDRAGIDHDLRKRFDN